jgi:hypothetical protein
VTNAPSTTGKRYLDWPVDDPAGKDLEAVRRIRDEIETVVSEAFVDELAPPPRPPATDLPDFEHPSGHQFFN